MRIRLFRNHPRTRTWGVGRLPVRQTVIWAGPVLVLVQRGGGDGMTQAEFDALSPKDQDRYRVECANRARREGDRLAWALALGDPRDIRTHGDY